MVSSHFLQPLIPKRQRTIVKFFLIKRDILFQLASIELMLFYTNSSLWDVETEYKILDFELMQLTSYSHFLWYDVIPSLEKRLIVMEAKVRDNTKDLLLFGDRVDTTHARQSYAENRISLLENSW